MKAQGKLYVLHGEEHWLTAREMGIGGEQSAAEYGGLLRKRRPNELCARCLFGWQRFGDPTITVQSKMNL